MGNKSSKERSKRTIHTDDAKFKNEILISSFNKEDKISRCKSTVLSSSSASDLDSNLEDDSTNDSSYKRTSFRRYESVTKYLKVLNCSTESLDIDDRNSDDSDKFNYSVCHEVQVLNTDDVQEIKQSFSTCKKNPDHHQFIPVDNFDLKHLPFRCRDDDLYHLIKAALNLSVRITVKCVSNHRPQFWPDSQRPYPFYCMPDNRVRFGSGTIEHVAKYIKSKSDVCPCKMCRFSRNPNQSWGLFRVSTATHVVFDDIEAKHTTCRLFYDNETSHVVDLEVIKVDTTDVKRDTCKLICVSCDMSLVTQLEQMVDTFINSWEKAFDHYYDDKIFAQEKFAVIVSHPHGYHKHISIGQWEEKVLVKGNETVFKRFTYDTPTCPGSAGAYVLITDFSN